MTEVSEELKNLELAENIFRDVKYYVTGDVDDNVLELLKAGGAERMNYFSDYVTHLICGTEPEETDLSDAAEIYEIPSVTVKWVIYSSQLKRLLNTKTYLYNTVKLFSNLTFCFSSIGNDRAALWALITYNGGVVQLNLDQNCNYLVTTSTTSEKYLKAESLGNEIITIVTPDWVVESVRCKSYAHAQLFHPKLITWPKIVKHESTTAITGFEPDEVNVSEGNLEHILPDSTQALLEELKQRMPWNQPQTSPSTEVVPPNVVAPSYTNSKLPQQLQEITQQQAVHQRLFSQQQQQQLNIQKQVQLSSNTFAPNPQQPSAQQQQQLQQQQQQQQTQQQQLNFLPPTSQVPRSIVHHPPQPPIPSQQQQQQQQSQLQFSVNQQQVPFSQASLTTSQRLRILEHMQQNRQRLTQQQFNQLQQQQRAQQINQQQQQIGQLQQESQMGQVNQQQQQQQPQPTNQINQLRQPVQNTQQSPQTSQQLILTNQSQLTQSAAQQLTQSAAQQLTQNQLSQETQQLLQSIQPGQQLIPNQVRQINQVTSQQVSSMAQLQMVQNQQQQQHTNLGQIAKSPSTLQQQHLTPQQLLQRQIQNQHLLKSQHILQNQQQQLQNQLNQQQQQNQISQQQQVQPVQQSQISQQLLQNQQSQLSSQTQLQQLSQQSQLEQQLTQNHLTQQQQQQQQQQIVQNQLNQRQLNQLNQHLLQNQLAQQQQLGQSQVVQQQQQQITQNQLNPQQQSQQQLRQNQINVQQQQLNQLSQQQINQNRLVIQQQQQQQQQQHQQQQNKLLQNQFEQQQIIGQQTVVVSQNQQNVLQQQFGSPNSQQFGQQTFVQSPSFTQAQQQQQQQLQQQQQQLLQAQQAPQQVICQPQPAPLQQQQQQQLLVQQQQIKPQQIITQQQLVNQKLNIQQITGQQHILLQQQQNQQAQNNQESPQRSAGTHLWQQQQPPPPPPTPTPQPQQPQQINIQRHPSVQGQGPRAQWAPNQQPGVVLPQRQYIHLDEQTHQQLQQMSPEDRALFVQKLHKHRQVLQSRMQQQQQQRAGHILIRGGVPIGLNSQQQMQWLQQAKQQGVVLQQNIQQPISQGTIVQQANPNIQHAPGLSPIQQQTQTFTDQNQQLQLQRQQQQQLRLQQLQLHQQQQREQAQKTVLQQQQPPPPPPLQQQQPPPPPPPSVVRSLSQTQVVDGNGVVPVPPPVVIDPNVVQAQNPLVVNSKTKTALANMLNTRLQSGGSSLNENIAEPSAAGTLKLMTAQHHASLNTGNRPHDLLFLQQRRIINRPNGEVIRPPPAVSAPPPQPDPPKLQYSPRNSVPLQHRPGTYYGHNPNLKLPPDLFLLGCVFVVVELERFLDESMPGWQKKIEKHGGEIEKQYCNRVTHVICETQRHGVVMQALRDYKRCVTLYWLSDVINRKQVLPPWIALHLPTMYWDTAPASKHLICLTGFQGAERDRIKRMIKYIGASLTTYFSKHNTLLVTTKSEGHKYTHAKKWGTPVVNVQWLTDIMLGHFSALNQTEHVKYQHFGDPPNFSFDPLLVPNLMHPWKMPINISQESYEKVKRSASPVIMPPASKPKKIKTEHVTTDENDNEEDVPKGFSTHRVLFSMCADVEELKKIVRQLGGTIAKTFRDCTHLVMPQLKRSHKLLCCICVGSYILPDSWLKDSALAGKFLDESNYSLDTKEFNSEFKCDFNQTLCTKNRNRLFEGKYFFITPSVVPRKKELIELTQCCGGMVEKTRRTLAQIEATNVNSPYSYVILTHENDLHMVADLLKNKNDKVRIVCNSELILSAILKQTFEVEPYAVKFL